MSATAEKVFSTPLKKSLLSSSQNAAITYAYERDYALLSLPMGTGKTVISLTAARELLDEKVLTKVLVVAPARVRDLVWAVEHTKWEHLQDIDLTVYPNASGDVVVVSFNQLADALKGDGYDGLIVDELTKLKSVSGAWFKALRPRLNSFKWRVGLTGTLADEGLVNLYGMAMIVDGGKALGRNKDMFLQRYFYQADYQGYKWEPRPDAAKHIAHKIKPFTYRVTEDDQGRPPCTALYTYVDMPPDARKVYDQMRKDMAVEIGDQTATAVNAAVLSGKLQQVCNGFVYTEEHGAIALHDAKLTSLRISVDAARGPVMIVYQWKHELGRLRSQYPTAHVLGDGVSKTQALETEQAWNRRELDVLLVHPASAGHGLNFQHGGSHLIFLGPIWSRDQTEQLIARLWRRGQRDPVTVEYLITRNSIEDCVIVPRVQGKGDGAAAFMEHLQNV